MFPRIDGIPFCTVWDIENCEIDWLKKSHIYDIYSPQVYEVCECLPLCNQIEYDFNILSIDQASQQNDSMYYTYAINKLE